MNFYTILVVMSHLTSAFKNLCIRVPVDPISKMPKSAYERNEKFFRPQCSIDSSSTCSVAVADVDAIKLKEFYRSIPDYSDINHLPPDEFYSTLKSLREKRKLMLGLAIELIDDNNVNNDVISDNLIEKADSIRRVPMELCKKNKSRRKTSTAYKVSSKSSNDSSNSSNNSKPLNKTSPGTCLKGSVRKSNTKKDIKIDNVKNDGDLKIIPLKSSLEKSRNERRNHSACSISWNDAKIEENKSEIDKKFDNFFVGKKYVNGTSKNAISDKDEFQTQSLPSSPQRTKGSCSPLRSRKSITIPKPFKMTERDEEERVMNELRCLQKSFSEDMLHQKCERKKKFRAKAVPIESRIPLYDKILQDQAMRFTHENENTTYEL